MGHLHSGVAVVMVVDKFSWGVRDRRVYCSCMYLSLWRNMESKNCSQQDLLLSVSQLCWHLHRRKYPRVLVAFLFTKFSQYLYHCSNCVSYIADLLSLNSSNLLCITTQIVLRICCDPDLLSLYHSSLICYITDLLLICYYVDPMNWVFYLANNIMSLHLFACTVQDIIQTLMGLCDVKHIHCNLWAVNTLMRMFSGWQLGPPINVLANNNWRERAPLALQ